MSDARAATSGASGAFPVTNLLPASAQYDSLFTLDPFATVCHIRGLTRTNTD